MITDPDTYERLWVGLLAAAPVMLIGLADFLDHIITRAEDKL